MLNFTSPEEMTVMKRTFIFSSLLLCLSGSAVATVFKADAAPGSNTTENGSKEKPGRTIFFAESTAVNGTLQESVNSDQTVALLPPVLLSISPTSGNRLQTLDVDFNGTSLQLPGETTSVNVGNGITVNSISVSLTKVTANLTITADAALGPRPFSVTTTGLLGGTSAPQTFTVNNPAPTLTSISPKSGGRSETLDIIFIGTNF